MLDRCSPNIMLRHVFVHGNRIELLYAGWSYAETRGGARDSKQGLLIVDASDPAAPKIVSNTIWPTGDEVWTPSAGTYGLGPIVELNRVADAVKTADSISLLEHLWGDTHQLRLRVIDVRTALLSAGDDGVQVIELE